LCEACCLRFSGEAAQLRRYSSALYGCLLPADKTPSRSCFVGNDAEFPDDTGFALKCWVKVSYDNNAAENGIQIHGGAGCLPPFFDGHEYRGGPSSLCGPCVR
jgi:hypothetical protein